MNEMEQQLSSWYLNNFPEKFYKLLLYCLWCDHEQAFLFTGDGDGILKKGRLTVCMYWHRSAGMDMDLFASECVDAF